MSVITGRSVLSGYLGLMRLGNCAMASLGALLAALICAGPEQLADYALEVALSMAIVVLFTGAGNSLNDYYDREVDKKAHPERPIPMGLVRPRAALVVSIAMFSAAFVLSMFVGPWPVAIVVTSMLFMVAYEMFLKAEGLAGNLTISWLTGALFLFGGAAVDSMPVASILAALAFLATLGREIIKDIQDIEGDRAYRTTLPMRVGTWRSGQLASAFLIGAVLLSPIPYLDRMLSVWYVPAVAVADAIFIYSSMVHFADPERGQRMTKLAMLVALVAFLLGGVL